MKRPIVESLTMDLNQAIEFNSSSTSSPQIHDFLPTTPLVLPFQQPSKDGEEGEHSQVQPQKRDFQLFWYKQIMEIHDISAFKSQHQLPLARIKRIMKSDKNVKMISADTPVLFSKACELFIMDLTLRAWLQTEEGRRRTLQRCDIARAISKEESLDFLADVVPLMNHRDGGNPPESDCHPVNQLQFPLLNMNTAMFTRSPELQQFMMKPPMSSNEFSYASAAKWMEPDEKEN